MNYLQQPDMNYLRCTFGSWAAAFLVIGLAGCGLTDPEYPYFVVRGVVEASGSPVEGARVRVAQLTEVYPGYVAGARSGPDGRFEVRFVNPPCGGRMSVSATKPGYQVTVIPDIPTDNCPGTLDGVRLLLQPNPPLVIETTSLPVGVPTVTYEAEIVAHGGDDTYTWSLVDGALPSGLVLNRFGGPGLTGRIRGTPTASGVWDFTVEVRDDADWTATADLSITVRAAVVLRPTDLCSANPDSAVVTFAEPDLRRAVREQSGIAEDELLTCGVVKAMTTLDASGSTLRHRRGYIANLAGLQNLGGLTWLDLSFSVIEDVGDLEGLAGLTWLDLSDNDVADLTPLAGLTALDSLWIGSNAVTSLDPLSGLEALTFLSAARNTVADVSPLTGLGSLRHVDLSWNDITTLPSLASLTALEVLDLERNALTSVDAIGGLSALTMLNLHRNQISDIGPLAGLARIVDLDLSRNAITDLSALQELTTLDHVSLWANASLSNIEPLIANTGLATGDIVSLTETAVSCADANRLRAKGVTVAESACG